MTLGTPEHHFATGMKLIDMGRYDDALREFDCIKQDLPAFPKAFVGSGLAWAHKGDWQKGGQDIEQARRLSRNDNDLADIHMGLVRLYTIAAGEVPGWLEKAESAYTKALRLKPHDPKVYYFMAEAYLAARKPEKAGRLYQKVLEMNGAYAREAEKKLLSLKNR